MTIQAIKENLKDYAKDTKINLGNLISEDAVDGLTLNQSHGTALACAYATKQSELIAGVTGAVNDTLSEEEVNAAKAAATIMAMNNVYYRFTHLVQDKSYMQMPAQLRMSVIGRPGIERVDFELYSLAISAINGCGLCMDAHVNEVIKGGVSKQGIQSAVRIASVVAAAAQALTIN